ncbi:dTDP-4-dehydrorhamnose reductase [Breznakia sp. OttesenSCG-928-G09]|nr:dTDP-4-dehydrorhamnose reductase [Breznakia sp. OttesenSCG-928-G09]
MKILVTGFKGQLGYDVVNEAKKNNIEAVGVDIDEMDITDKAQVDKVILNGNYDAVIHCAAYTAVDKAEEQEDLCRKINVEGTGNIVSACQKLNIPVMYFSTDYVFDGTGEDGWKEYGSRKPLNVYGQTKYEGEKIVENYEKHFIIRISWVFGVNGNNFVKTMLRLGREKDLVKVVDDQIGSPTYTYDLAVLVIKMIQTKKYGTYHASNEGICSWYDFAAAIFDMANLPAKIEPTDSGSFPSIAKRPSNSRLCKDELDKKGFERLPSWQDALERYLAVLAKEE